MLMQSRPGASWPLGRIDGVHNYYTGLVDQSNEHNGLLCIILLRVRGVAQNSRRGLGEAVTCICMAHE